MVQSDSVNGNLITSGEAASILGLTDRQVRNLSKILKAEKFGGVWLVNRSAVMREKQRRKERNSKPHKKR